MMASNDKIYRIIDANANRAREGLRVVEEYLRLACDCADLTVRLKHLRHGITEALSALHSDERFITARQSDTDVGATEPAGSEGRRDDVDNIVVSNFRRYQEALRELE